MKKVFLILSFLISAGCNLHGTSPLALDPNATTKSVVQQGDDDTIPYMSAAQITYALVNEKILSKKCVMCHSEKSGNKGHVNLENYQNVFAAKAQIRAEVYNRTMPPKKMNSLKLSDSQIQFILDWIDLGAHEKVDPALPADPAEPTEPVNPPPVNPPPNLNGDIYFADVMEQVLKPSCIKCHGKSAGVNLETYENFVPNKDTVREQVMSGDMPIKSKLTDEQKKLILTWIDQGAKEKEGAPPAVLPPPVVLPPIPAELLNGPIYFADVSEYALKRNCVRCHSGAQEGGMNALLTYAQVMDYIDDIQESVEAGGMPMGKVMPADEKALLLKWIANGTPEKAP